ILLSKGIYGSFIFTFSIPLLWQIGLKGKRLDSLGLKRQRLNQSIIIGIISGIVLGLLGGTILKAAAISGYSFSGINRLNINFGLIKMAFPLDKELSYILLTKSASPLGALTYLVFSVLAIGLGEEIFWRGFIQTKISKHTGKNISLWLTSALFALIHFYIFAILPFVPGIFFIAIIFAAGLIWGHIFRLSGSIWSVAISHGITAFIIWKYFFFKIN
ncbi:MAG: CPBP family intramembrane glutamic endopeptidase, partial [Candidatus Omnitrophota bacterium]